MYLNMFAYEIDLSMWGNYAAGCNYVFAFETQTFLFEEDVCWCAFLQIGPGTIEFGTGAKFAVQRIGHIGHSL